MSEEQTERMQMRVSKAFLKIVDDWRRKQPDLPSRSEAIRRLVELGLASAPTPLPRTKGRRRASDMAATAIDAMVDTSASSEDQAKRKRRLLKGPEEFRSARGDQPKRRK
jgi:hypothetical protein